MDVRTHTYHIALVQIYLFIFYFSSYFMEQKINYINVIKSINQSINHGAKGNPCLVWGCEAIQFLKRPDIESGGDEETDGVGDELPIRLWVAAKERCFCAFLNSAEKDFGGVCGQVGALENCIVCFKGGQQE
jgi:hypothetical protein